MVYRIVSFFHCVWMRKRNQHSLTHTFPFLKRQSWVFLLSMFHTQLQFLLFLFLASSISFSFKLHFMFPGKNFPNLASTFDLNRSFFSWKASHARLLLESKYVFKIRNLYTQSNPLFQIFRMTITFVFSTFVLSIWSQIRYSIGL